MPDRIEFFIAHKPKPKGNAQRIMKHGTWRSVVPDEDVRVAERCVKVLALEHRPPRPFSGAVRLDVTFVRRIPESWAKWKREAAQAGLLYPTSAPDRGNLLKLIEDALQGAFYENDAQIVAGEVAKAYGEIAGYRIVLEQLPEATRAARAPEIDSELFGRTS